MFLDTADVALWIGRLANQDIRRSLRLTREIVSSPHINVTELLGSYLQRSAIEVDPDNIKLAIIKGRYDIFSGNLNSFVQNIYSYPSISDTTPLLGMRLLKFISDRWEQNKDSDARYVDIETIHSYFLQLGILSNLINPVLQSMLECGLVLSYNPLIKVLTSTSRIEIAPSGRQHLSWSIYDWIYLESMAVVTPLLNQELRDRIATLATQELPHLRRELIGRFIGYLLQEDSYYCKVPEHEQFRGQKFVTDELNKQFEVTKEPANIGSNTRFSRSFGHILKWYDDKGYGFIRPDLGGQDLFVHVSDIMDRDGEIALTDGRKVEYDTSVSERGIRASKVLMLLGSK